MRSSSITFLLVCVCLAVPSVHAQTPQRDWSNEEYARTRISQIAAGFAAGQRSVAEHDSLIELHAAAHGVDPDWLRAIIIAEATRPLEEVGDRIGPMGMDVTTWAGFDGASPASFSDPSENIRLAALLIQRVVARLPAGNRTLRVVASLYDDVGANTVTPYGLRVEQAYARRSWESRAGG